MSRCRHRDVRGWTRTAAGGWSPTCNGSRDSALLNRAYLASLDRVTCMDCPEWLPLGPANDTPEVLVEVRAAELAQGAIGLLTWPLGEFRGWMASEMAERTPDDPEGQSGWLAREIYTHREPNRD